MKIHILKKLIDGPWGGGNQFLKSLRSEWRDKGLYAETPLEADGILLNSHHDLAKAVALKYFFPKKCFVHRVDGPIYLARKTGDKLDDLIFRATGLIAEGVVFQSEFSRRLCLDAGMPVPGLESTIINAPDPKIFYPDKTHQIGKKIRLIATSWSTNPKKGFDIYDFLDKNLDFKRFDMTFVGNSSVKFRNIKWLPPQKSKDLAVILRMHDIFLTASMFDPCSNSLLEGLHSGLPAVARNSGGHPEIVGKAGVLFDGKDDVLEAIDSVSSNYEFYRKNIDLPGISQVASMYYQLFVDAVSARKNQADLNRPSLISGMRFYAEWGWLRANHLI